jgi:peptidoglycan/LPS O-acetylase OafA/YrhL
MHMNQQDRSSHDASPSHIIGLDILRFAAAMLVVLFHYGLFKGGGATVFKLAPWTHFGWVGVQIFFVLSGFVIAFSARRAKAPGFLAARFIRLVPGVWVCAPISLAAAQILDPAATGPHVERFLNSLFFNPMGPWIEISYWTLAIEIVFYALILMLLAGGRFHWVRRVAITLGAVSAAFWLLWKSSEFGVAPPFLASMTWCGRFWSIGTNRAALAGWHYLPSLLACR